MDHSTNKIVTAFDLVEHLLISARDRETRAWLVIEYGTEEQKVKLLEAILEMLRRPWRHQGDETDWRAEVLLDSLELCEKNGLLEPRDKKNLPIPKRPPVTKEEKSVLVNKKTGKAKKG